ncbi:hypothetical protein QQ045_011504 [Rhodiola kirilowii]
MAYEYQESDIIFSEHEHQGDGEDINSSYYIWPPQPQRKSSADGGRLRSRSKKLRGNHSSSSSSSSLPISIPERDHFQWENESDEEEGWEGGDEVVPPHLIVARRVAGKMEFSVCSGKGRTLKGRDLKEVRNEILRMTGFLEA